MGSSCGCSRKCPMREVKLGPARGALLGIGALLLSGCSLLGVGPDRPTPPPGTIPPTSERPTGVDPGGDDEPFGQACTGDGEFLVDSSVVRDIEGAPEAAGGQLQVSLGYASVNGPAARLYLSTAGAMTEPEQFDGGVGDSARFDGWTLTVTSICAGEVRFDVEAVPG